MKDSHIYWILLTANGLESTWDQLRDISAAIDKIKTKVASALKTRARLIPHQILPSWFGMLLTKFVMKSFNCSRKAEQEIQLSSWCLILSPLEQLNWNLHLLQHSTRCLQARNAKLITEKTHYLNLLLGWPWTMQIWTKSTMKQILKWSSLINNIINSTTKCFKLFCYPLCNLCFSLTWVLLEHCCVEFDSCSLLLHFLLYWICFSKLRELAIKSMYNIEIFRWPFVLPLWSFAKHCDDLTVVGKIVVWKLSKFENILIINDEWGWLYCSIWIFGVCFNTSQNQPRN